MNRRHFLSTLSGAALALPFGRAAASPAADPRNGRPDLAQQLADYAAGLQYHDLDAATVETVKAHLIDALGCAIAAHDERPVRIARDAALASPGGVATVIGTAQRTSPDLAAFATGTALRYFDFNDAYAGKETGHPSDNMSACLAVAEAQHASGRELILSIAIAYEIACRLMDAAAISPRGWDHTCYSLPAVALAAGKLMRLPAPQLVQAISLSINSHLALNQTRVQELSNWKALADADAARNAVFSTQLARAGLTGPSPIFEGMAGFFPQVSGPFALDTGEFGGRGGAFRIGKCFVKFYPAQGLTQTAIPAALDVAAQVGDLRRIRRIEIHTTEVGYVTAGRDREKWAPSTHETADHSLPYIVARAMLDGDITTESYRHDALHDPALRVLIDKVTVHADPALTARYPAQAPNRVTAVRDDGATFTKQVDDLPGSPTRPMQRGDYEAKFAKNCRRHWRDAQTRAALDYLWRLDEQSDVAALPSLLVVG
ncbi:2-methylcitrate dehydratase [Burkholderia stagnalis]|uniref:MmgE/PrpD family protein n=1 Tax=Burkholderia stagnalis TaxID=1503054 RepID=UPI00075FECA0|nr:MmgE/PrpD family protein [Burkholderia stagnalis]KWK48295.1 2-methylcitrate dehydratase [Burkholderia stagnalis]KWK54628.1 2-methylcitrate dehydratase [Burkholderia stagnalis]KWN76297.1 2-methylcitrate dehydratase [Burkholderia stagnalis]